MHPLDIFGVILVVDHCIDNGFLGACWQSKFVKVPKALVGLFGAGCNNFVVALYFDGCVVKGDGATLISVVGNGNEGLLQLAVRKYMSWNGLESGRRHKVAGRA